MITRTQEVFSLAQAATQLRDQPADASLLLIEAAAMLAVQGKLGCSNLSDHFVLSYAQMNTAEALVEAMGNLPKASG